MLRVLFGQVGEACDHHARTHSEAHALLGFGARADGQVAPGELRHLQQLRHPLRDQVGRHDDQHVLLHHRDQDQRLPRAAWITDEPTFRRASQGALAFSAAAQDRVKELRWRSGKDARQVVTLVGPQGDAFLQPPDAVLRCGVRHAVKGLGLAPSRTLCRVHSSPSLRPASLMCLPSGDGRGSPADTRRQNGRCASG